jgi:sugar phosphate isomerase/epimerase
MPAFRYCLNSSTIKPTPLLDKIRVAAAAGYAGIEIWHDHVEAFLSSGGALRDVRHALDDHQLAVPTTIYLKGWWDPALPEYAVDMDVIKRRLEQSATLGAPHVISGPPPQSEVNYPLLARQYRALLELGRQYGVRPAFEYLGFVDEVNSLTKALRVLGGADHPDATVVIDPFHDFRGGSNHEAIARLRADQIAVSHFNDAPPQPAAYLQGDADRVMPGDGCVDLKRYVALLKQVGYDRFVSLELFREDLWRRDPLEVARVGLEKMRGVCEG